MLVTTLLTDLTYSEAYSYSVSEVWVIFLPKLSAIILPRKSVIAEGIGSAPSNYIQRLFNVVEQLSLAETTACIAGSSMALCL